MNIEKTFQGAWRMSEIINNQLVTMQYFTPKKEAISLFKNHIKNIKK
jgi:hypothetical protein